MSNLEKVLNEAPNNELIKNTFIKADKLLTFYRNPVCSISGGSDSDIMLDILERVRGGRQVTYVFFDTGIEYEATKRHLDYLERKYDIKIERRRAKIPVPAGCREFGVPLLSKDVAEKIEALQRNNFQFEDEPFEILVKKYPTIKSYLSWWCNMKNPKYNINAYKYLKEFLNENGLDFRVSSKCCNGAKKHTAKDAYKEFECGLTIIGERKREGGVRSTAYSSCFDIPKDGEIPSYRPLWFWEDSDKQEYKDFYRITYSDCYEVYGMTRTGCAGCPFNSKFEDALKIIHEYEPRLEVAVNNIFGNAYDFMRRYRNFKNEKRAEEKAKK